MMCQMIGRPPISTIGFGRTSVSSESLVPRPPARITTFPTFIDSPPVCFPLMPGDSPAQPPLEESADLAQRLYGVKHHEIRKTHPRSPAFARRKSSTPTSKPAEKSSEAK